MRATSLILMLVVESAACDGASAANRTGNLNVLLEPESTITEGLNPGDAEEDTRDGWQVRYSQYVAAVGPVSIQRVTKSSQREVAGTVIVVDLARLPPAGVPFWSIDDLDATRWDFNFELAAADSKSERHESVSESSFARMQSEALTYWIQGNLAKEGGETCPPTGLAKPGGHVQSGRSNRRGDPCYANTSIRFDIATSLPVALGPCSIDEMRGVSIPSGGTQSVAITIHGDHIFFNGFPESTEASVTRLAQWLADCDLNIDGEITEAELEAISISELAEIDSRYHLGGSPLSPLETAWDYVRAQLQTQGHFQGEGECPAL